MSSPNADYFDSSPSWKSLVDSTPSIQSYLAQPHKPKDVVEDRAAQLTEEAAWAHNHPAHSYGYATSTHRVQARDGAPIAVKVYTPSEPLSEPTALSKALPILFVTHGGGFVQGTAVTEERWLVAPLLSRLKAAGNAMVVINVEYRRAPEHRYPGPLRDCEDVLRAVFAGAVSSWVDGGVGVDAGSVFLAGSSAGSCIAAQLSLWARDDSFGGRVAGVILNVPVVCHPDVFPVDRYPWASSHEEGREVGSTILTMPAMRDVWRLHVGDGDVQAKKDASPLLQDLRELPPHVLFVAGQDCLRDEGLAYAQALKEAGVAVDSNIYPGVPHIFGEIWSLPETEQYQRNLSSWVLGVLERRSRR